MKINISDNKIIVVPDDDREFLIKCVKKRVIAERIAFVSALAGALATIITLLIFKCRKDG